MVSIEKDENYSYYEVTGLPNGETWTFDEEEADLEYIETAIMAWQTWRDYVIREGLTYNAD